ncbi:MAG TPA: hypothetical protein VFH17_00225 [Coriobacteriia bacterium]|nr:hypothetical protein [Coriobacteriia bacterium]
MSGLDISWDELKGRTYMARPHAVILGAGASLAAFPHGDRFGQILPLMNNLVEVLELASSIEAYGLDPSGNFEDTYSELASNLELADLRELVENRVVAYFSDLRLPDTPTIYDYMVLSLREKDYIATFNWDPFLYMACWRNSRVAPLPSTLYLHGCSVVGYCLEHRTMGHTGSKCSVCGTQFTPTRLLYPVRDKDYTADGFINAQWDSIQFVMQNAWLFTVFGYGAPASDAAAIKLLDDAWGGPDKRNLEEIEIIDIRPEDQLAESWSRFIHTHHYRATGDYFRSLLGTFPRRTGEAMWEQLMEARFLEYRSVPRFESLDALQEYMAAIASFESEGN